MTLYEVLFYFVIYAVLGWCVEVAYAAVSHGKLVNRGFLNGPWCPIYGFGMLAALLCLSPVLDSWPLLFLGGMILTSVIELVGGWALYKLYHTRWWDYSSQPFNLGGFICLKFSILWGLGVVIILRVVHPSIAALLGLLPRPVGWVLLAVLYLSLAADLLVTLFTVAGLNRDLDALETVTDNLREISDALTERVGTAAMNADQRLDEAQLQFVLAKAEARDAAGEARDRVEDALDELREDAAQHAALRRAELEARREELEHKSAALRAHIRQHPLWGGERLLNAFPDLHRDDRRKALEELQKHLR